MVCEEYLKCWRFRKVSDFRKAGRFLCVLTAAQILQVKTDLWGQNNRFFTWDEANKYDFRLQELNTIGKIGLARWRPNVLDLR